MRSRTAIIFTLDAIFAVLLGLSIILASLFYIYRTSIPTGAENLQLLSMDVLSVMEKNGELSLALTGGTHPPLQEVLPANICSRLTLYSATSEKILTTSKTGCGLPGDYVITRQVFLVDKTIYYAELELWYT
jgi:hypothetical protein